MARKLKLEIEIGNDAMQTRLDVAEALERVAIRLKTFGLDRASSKILDVNGNTVGKWQIT